MVAHRAPFIANTSDSAPRERLVSLLRLLQANSEEILTPESAAIDSDMPQRILAYQKARLKFIELGTRVTPTSDPRAMLAQVRAPMLYILRISPDFRPAYDPLLNMAGALATTDRDAARALLADLEHVQPARIEAMQWRQRLVDAQNNP